MPAAVYPSVLGGEVGNGFIYNKLYVCIYIYTLYKKKHYPTKPTRTDN